VNVGPRLLAAKDKSGSAAATLFEPIRFATAWLSLLLLPGTRYTLHLVLDSEENRESVGDSNTAAMDSLKVLGPEPPIREEADTGHSRISAFRLSKADISQTPSGRLR